MIRLAGLISVGFALSSCAYGNKVPMTGCNHPSGWSDQIRSMAITAYPYAMLAVNAYDDNTDLFQMEPQWQKLATHPNNKHGMAYDVWLKRTGPKEEIVLAFRGTEFSHLSDWRDGNFLTKQNADGVSAFDSWRAKYPEADFSVTGHSLGGGIATQISLSRPNVRSFIFNSSPRFRAPRQPEINARVSVVEYGEVLKIVRLLGREAAQDYYSLGCVRGNPVSQHGGAPLAKCLVQVASWDSVGAQQSLRQNGISLPTPADPPRTALCSRSKRNAER